MLQVKDRKSTLCTEARRLEKSDPYGCMNLRNRRYTKVCNAIAKLETREKRIEAPDSVCIFTY
jgi:hypothetical protein